MSPVWTDRGWEAVNEREMRARFDTLNPGRRGWLAARRVLLALVLAFALSVGTVVVLWLAWTVLG